MYTALTLRSACSSSSYKLPMSGVEGGLPSSFSGGYKGGYSLLEENTPFIARFRTVRKTPARDAGFVFA